MGKIEDHKDYILHQYLLLHHSAGMIARELGVSRQGVILALNSWGIDTSKAGSKVELTCDWCGQKRIFPRSKARKKVEGKEKVFCSRECYGKWVREQFS